MGEQRALFRREGVARDLRRCPFCSSCMLCIRLSTLVPRGSQAWRRHARCLSHYLACVVSSVSFLLCFFSSRDRNKTNSSSDQIRNIYQLYVKETLPLWVLRVYNLVESFLLLGSCTRLYDSQVHTEHLVGKAKSDSKDLFMASNYHFEALWSIIFISV